MFGTPETGTNTDKVNTVTYRNHTKGATLGHFLHKTQLQWSLHFKTTHSARKMPEIKGGLNMEG